MELAVDDDGEVEVEIEECEAEYIPSARILLPLRDVPTRWSSKLQMLERSVKIRKGLDATTSQREWRSSDFIEEG